MTNAELRGLVSRLEVLEDAVATAADAAASVQEGLQVVGEVLRQVGARLAAGTASGAISGPCQSANPPTAAATPLSVFKEGDSE